MKQRGFNILLSGNGAFKKYDKILAYGGKEAMVINVEKTNNYTTTLTVYPIKKSKYRIVNAVRIFVIKLKVFFGLIK